MERRMINTLIVNDQDLNCNCDSLTLDEINISKLGFVNADLDKFDLIVYKGKRGSKVVRTKFW